jgi:hypothetical protein
MAPADGGLTMPSPIHTLHYGKSKKPLAWVKPDDRYPTMWRIHWPDGSISDMVNLSRACDAAMAIAERGPPPQRPRDRKMFHWIRDASKQPPRAGDSAFDAAPLSD